MDKRLEKTPNKISTMFNSIAVKYDHLNDLSTFGIVRLWRKYLIKYVNAKKNQKILDIAAGTGTSTIAIKKEGVEITAVDISAKMLDEARKKYPEITFIQADATKLPFPDNTFDTVTISFGLRNIQNPQKALKEMYRVTNPEGKIVICEFSMPENKILNTLYRIYMKVILQNFLKIFTKNISAYKYLSDSIINWYKKDELLLKLYEAGWRKNRYKKLTLGIVAIHMGKKTKS